MNLTKSELKKKFTRPLPGLAAQLKMAPYHRAVELEALKSRIHSARQSAVLILLYPENEALKTVFIKRSEYEGVHSGQIAFPGGKREDSDASFERTALREAREEVGVDLEQVEIIGQLSELFVPPSNFLIKPFVGYCTRKPEYVLDQREVQSVVEVYLDEFTNHNAVLEKEFLAKALNSTLKAPYYAVSNVEIWGATAMIMSELLEVLKK